MIDIESDRAAQEARDERLRRIQNEACRYYVPNGKIDFYIQEIGRRFKPGKRIWKCILRGGNGIGKSVLSVNSASYLADQYRNFYFDQAAYLRDFPRPNRGRIFTTVNGAKNNYDMEFQKWLRRGKYRTLREGKHFNNKYRFENGSEFDIFTFDQPPEQNESVTLNWVIVDEPLPYELWKGLKFRLRFGGIIMFHLTALEGAAWMSDELEIPERLKDDVLVVQGSSEDNCLTHGVRGMTAHETLEDQWRDCDEAQLIARRDGGYAEHGGRIYQSYRDDLTGHVLAKMPPYYAECWRKGLYTLHQVIDPHDRKPWAIAWYAFFPNGADICVAEWPDMSMRPFHKIKSWNWGYDAYARLTVETEAALGVKTPAHMTVMDPNYGPSAAMTKDTVTSIGAEFQRSYREITGRSRKMCFPNDAITPGHLLVKEALGEPAALDPERRVAPMTFVMEYCHNMRYSLLNYGYKENRDEKKGLSEAPVLQFKDFSDLRRYLATSRAGYIAHVENVTDSVLSSPERRENGRARP